MTTLAAFQTLLHRYSGQRDVVVGTPVANRSLTQFEGIIGFFVNSVALRADFSGDPTFRELLRRVRSILLDAFVHQELPFERLVSEPGPTAGKVAIRSFRCIFSCSLKPQRSTRTIRWTATSWRWSDGREVRIGDRPVRRSGRSVGPYRVHH